MKLLSRLCVRGFWETGSYRQNTGIVCFYRWKEKPLNQVNTFIPVNFSHSAFLNIYHIKIDLTKYTKLNTYTFHFLIKRQSIKITKKNPNIFYKITPPLWIIQLRLPPQGGGGPCPHAPVLHTGMLGSLGLEVEPHCWLCFVYHTKPRSFLWRFWFVALKWSPQRNM